MNTVDILGIAVPITEDIQEAMENHADFCSLGQAVLCRIDPGAEKEQELLDAVQDAVEQSFESAIQHLSEDEQDLLLDDMPMSVYHDDEIWEDLQAACGVCEPVDQ